jgi:hypothetical protein
MVFYSAEGVAWHEPQAADERPEDEPDDAGA